MLLELEGGCWSLSWELMVDPELLFDMLVFSGFPLFSESGLSSWISSRLNQAASARGRTKMSGREEYSTTSVARDANGRDTKLVIPYERPRIVTGKRS